jgi:hypothetical protein
LYHAQLTESAVRSGAEPEERSFNNIDMQQIRIEEPTAEDTTAISEQRLV